MPSAFARVKHAKNGGRWYAPAFDRSLGSNVEPEYSENWAAPAGAPANGQKRQWPAQNAPAITRSSPACEADCSESTLPPGSYPSNAAAARIFAGEIDDRKKTRPGELERQALNLRLLHNPWNII